MQNIAGTDYKSVPFVSEVPRSNVTELVTNQFLQKNRGYKKRSSFY